MLGAQSFDEPRRWFSAGGIESQIERSFALETEPALGICELVARQSEVEKDPINRRYFKLLQHLR